MESHPTDLPPAYQPEHQPMIAVPPTVNTGANAPQTVIIYQTQQNTSTAPGYKKKVAKYLGIGQILIGIACIFLQGLSFITPVGFASVIGAGFWGSIFVS